MNFIINSRPLKPTRKRLQTESYRFSILNIFSNQGKARLHLNQLTPAKLRQSNVVKLQKIKKKAKSGFNLYPLHDLALNSINFCVESHELHLLDNCPSKIKKNTSCKDNKSSTASLSPCKQEKSKRQLKNYFKHLNLNAENHSSFVGASALLHKRQTKLRIKNRSSLENSKSYRNGNQSVASSVLPKSFQLDLRSSRSLKYQFCKSDKIKPSIGPWEGHNEDGTALPSPRKLLSKASICIEVMQRRNVD